MNPVPRQPSSRMAVQGALAVTLALAVNRLLGLERPFWGALMAVVVIAGAWGENLQRLRQLLLGTLAAVAGSLAFLYLAGDRPLAVVAVCLVCLFMWAYNTPTNYAFAAAWMGAFAIIAVSFAAGHRHEIALLRGIQVLIGGTIGILASAFVLPVGIGADLERMIRDLEDYLREAGRKAFSFLEGETGEDDRGSTIEIYRRLARVIELGRTAANQYLAFPRRRREIAGRINRLRRLALYVNGLAESLSACREREITPGLRELFAQASGLVGRSLEDRPGGEKIDGAVEEGLGALRGLLTGEINARRGEFPRRDLAPYLMFIFYVRGIAETAAAVPPGLAVHPDGHTAGLEPPPVLDKTPGG